jgi:hypothetical protein
MKSAEQQATQTECTNLMFTPEVPGEYTVIARFEGSNSYYASHAQTALGVEVSQPTIQPTDQPQSVADMYFVPAIVGIIVAIVLVGVVIALLLLKKRP